MSLTSEIEKAGIALVRPLLMEWCECHEGFIDTNTAQRSADWQRTLGDFLVKSKKTGRWVAVEVKTEERWTGNFFAETYSNAQPGAYERHGWLLTLKADALVNVFLDRRVAVVMSFPSLRQWLIEEENAYRYERRVPHRDQRNLTVGHIVPFDDLARVESVRPAFYQQQPDGGWASCPPESLGLRKPTLAA